METPSEILQEKHFYPFGMEMERPWMQSGANNPYQYNGKELVSDFGLNLIDYGARWYDAAAARWWSVDPLGEKYSPFSTYAYVVNNPMLLTDPNGMNIRVSGDMKSLHQLIKHVFNGQIEGRVNNGNLTLHKKGAGKDDKGLDAEKDYEFISGLDQGGQVLFGVMDKAIQSDDDTNLEFHKSSADIVGGAYGKDIQKVDVGDQITLDKLSGGLISAAGGFAHEVEEAYQQQVKGNAFDDDYHDYGKEGTLSNGHRLGLDVEGKANGYTITNSWFKRGEKYSPTNVSGKGYTNIKRGNSPTIFLSFTVEKGKIKSFEKLK
ncbi:MAG: RHS repeat-associated core domain-containing protein [Chitinophagales bacterium]